jgi:hypothetical protein
MKNKTRRAVARGVGLPSETVCYSPLGVARPHTVQGSDSDTDKRLAQRFGRGV